MRTRAVVSGFSPDALSLAELRSEIPQEVQAFQCL